MRPRFLILSGILVVLVGIAAFGSFRAERVATGPLADLQASYSGIVFTVVESDVVSLGGMDRIRALLEPLRGRGNISGDEFLMGLCGSVLSAKAALDNRGLDRNRVFRISLQVRHEDQNLYENYIPITVSEGACRPDKRRGLYVLRYPEPIRDYILDRIKPMDGQEDGIELVFTHDADTEAVLSDFSFRTACAYVALDRPAVLSGLFPYNETRQVRIVARTGNSFGILKTWRNLQQTFNWADGACIPVGSGEPA